MDNSYVYPTDPVNGYDLTGMGDGVLLGTTLTGPLGEAVSGQTAPSSTARPLAVVNLIT